MKIYWSTSDSEYPIFPGQQREIWCGGYITTLHGTEIGVYDSTDREVIYIDELKIVITHPGDTTNVTVTDY